MFCVPSAVNVTVRSEGLAERLGDILLSCSQGTPGAVIQGNLTVFLSVNVTNKLDSANGTDAVLTIDTGGGPVASGAAGLLFTANAVAFHGVHFTVPASGRVDLRISNLRGAANELGLVPQQVITASISFPAVVTSNAIVTVGVTQRGLLATAANGAVSCAGSPAPAAINLTNLFAAGTRFASVRLTEGFAGAFQKKDALSDTGTRVMLHYSGFPAGARLFVPDAVAGSSTIQPTSAGDFGAPRSGGQYTAGAAGSLLLARVTGVNSDGSGGAVTSVYPGFGIAAFDAAGEVPLADGAGIAVYEVVDSNPGLRESAQIPTFLGIASASIKANALASADVSLAPVSTLALAGAAPVPRFVQVEPPSDCGTLADCTASYFPHLYVSAASLDYAAPFGAFLQTRYVQVLNLAGGVMNWTATIHIPSGPQWLTLEPASGTTGATVRIDAHPDRVPPGTYQATVTIGAGPLTGSRILPVTFTVGPPLAAITSVQNSATLTAGPLAPGSLATVLGLHLGGSPVVTFDGQPALPLYTADSEIILQVPESLAGKTSATVAVLSAGVSSAPLTVALAPVAPGIFGTLNQDNTLNGPSRPAPPGTVVQIFATGLISPGSGAISAWIGDREILAPYYAGPAPQLTGVQQVNLFVPEDLAPGTTAVKVCAAALPAARPVCGPPAPLVLSQ